MTIKRFAAPFLALSFLALAATPSSLRGEAWAHETSDLKPDTKAVWGRLANGLRYVVYPNKFPVKERASMRLYIDAGSLMEEDDQQGMAHFLEHLAFNGSKNFPAGTMVERFQRLGMGFGADTNAHTSFKETVYKLEFPHVDEKTLSEGMQLFRDDLDGLLLGEEEINKERGVILSEKLARDSVETRIMEEGYRFSLPDSLIPKRMPIGIEDTLKTMPRPRFADFYKKWYIPQRAVLVVVGDVDIPLMEKLIHQHFDSIPAAPTVPEDPSLGKVTKGRGLVAKLHTEMEAPAVEISLETLRDASKEPDSAKRRREKMIRTLADAMLNQRLSRLGKEENSPILEAESYNFEMFKFVESNGIFAKCKPENWKRALALIEQELRRAVQHGFSKAEFAEATAEVLKRAQLRAAQMDTRKNSDLADNIVRSLGSEQVFTDPKDDAKRVEEELKTITAADSLKALQDDWSTKDIQLFVGGNLQLEDAPKTIAAALVESAHTPVEAPNQQTDAAFAYTDFGPVGQVAERKEVKDLEITQIVLSNEVRVNIKKTDFEKNSILVQANFGGGKLSAPLAKAGIIPYAQSVFQEGGLEKHSVDELRRILASKTVGTDRSVGLDFTVADDSFAFSGKTTPQDLETQLQVFAAYFTAPGYRAEADRQFKMSLDAIYTQLEHTAEGVMQNEVVGFIHSGDSRFLFPKREVMAIRSMEELKAWLTPALKESYLEVSIVGDVDIEKTIAALEKTLGALPKREATRQPYETERKVAFPGEPKNKDFSFTTEIPRAYALAYWPTADMMNVQRTRRLVLLGQILDDRLRLRIREELGETYSPASYHVASDTFTGYGYMTAMATLKPEQVESVKPMFLDIATAISGEGITDDEFQRAREPQLQQLVQMRRDNKYWLGRVLVNSQAQPFRLDWSRSLIDDFTGIKKEELEALAKEFLLKNKAITLGLMPIQEKK